MSQRPRLRTRLRGLLRGVLRGVLIAAALIGAAAGAAPGTALALNAGDARHLLARTGFGATPADIDALAAMTREEAVEAILARSGEAARTPPPDWTENWQPPRTEGMSEAERLALRDTRREQGRELKGWWLAEMRATPTPLTEVMTLFWHNHFTSSLQKVKVPALMYRQNVLLRRHALGNFAALLHAVARDPAMLIYLDNARSRKEAPNENFARELLELFTLGEGRYDETDLKEAARAFTGWSLDPASAQFKYRPRWHDSGQKEFLGTRGAYDGDDVIDLLLARPETAEFIVAKLWRRFVSETPDPVAVTRLAAVFRSGGYEIRPLLSALFTSQAFWAAENRGRLVKSPVDLIVGTLRLFDLPVADDRDVAWLTRRLGQDLLDPPNVKGWPGGTAWITGASLLDRQSLLLRVTGALASENTTMAAAAQSKAERRAAFFDRWIADLPPGWTDAASVTRLMLAIPPIDAEVLDRRASGALVRSLLADPAYHLK